MEVSGAKANIPRVMLYEFLGTMTFTVAFTWVSYENSVPGVAMIYAVLYFMLHKVSGAHFNPAITISVMIREPDGKASENVKSGMLMILAQVLGVVIGCFTGLLGRLY